MREVKATISVIVPIYNSENHLEKCIDSILNQTYSNFELILINDGSKDSSGQICDSYSYKDSRIKVYHKENGGASSARNLGIDKATGDYLVFVDSDDFVDDDYLSAFFVDSLKSDKHTLVIQSVLHVYDKNRVELPKLKEGLYTEDNFSKLFFSINETILKGYSVGKLYSRKIINKNNIRFNHEIFSLEDLVFMMTYLSYVNNVYLSTEAHYNYISTEGSLSKEYHSFESEILTFFSLKQAYINLANRHHIDKKARVSIHKNTLGAQLIRSISTLYRPNSKKIKQDRISILRKIFSDENVKYLELYTQNGIIINRIGFKLYKRKYFVAFDLFYSAVYFTRYKLNNQWQKYLQFKNSQSNKKSDSIVHHENSKNNF